MTEAEQPPMPFPRRSWVDSDPPTGQRLAWHRLSAAMRKINEALMDMDAPEADLLAAATIAEQFAATLESTRTGRQHWGFAESSTSGSTHAMLDRSPIIGLGNPVAPPLTFKEVDGEVEGTGTFGLQYEGPPGHVHGGFVSAAFDEVLVMFKEDVAVTRPDIIEVAMPVGLYTSCEVSAPCGLCSTESIIGLLDVPDFFLDPSRMRASLVWFGRGFVEYKFPNNAKLLNTYCSHKVTIRNMNQR